MTVIGVVKVNRHVFWLTKEYRRPRVYRRSSNRDAVRRCQLSAYDENAVGRDSDSLARGW